MKLAKKPIALFLVLLMFLSLLPVGVFAVDDAELTEEAEIVEALPPEEDALPFLQNMQPPTPFVPSMLGQVQPCSSATRAAFPPKRAFRYQSKVMYRLLESV